MDINLDNDALNWLPSAQISVQMSVISSAGWKLSFSSISEDVCQI